MEEGHKTGLARLIAPFTEVFGLSRSVALAVFVSVGLILFVAVFWFFYSAPPHIITITSGTAGSGFETNAVRYARILASNGS